MTDKKENIRHFIDLDKVEASVLRRILDEAATRKQETKNGTLDKPLEGKQLAMIFEKPSTRTRASFEVGINQLGGNAIILDTGTSQLGRGETIADTARVMSRYADIIMIRTFKHRTVEQMAEHASVPVINGLTNRSHPCQVMADILTLEERRGAIEGKTVAWVGDYHNMAATWVQAADIFGFMLHLTCPEELKPSTPLPDCVTYFSNPQEAVADADCVTTDTWVSMGDDDAEYKRKLLKPYQVNDALMAQAKDEAIFLHCLPAHRGEEVTDTVIDGTQSAVWDEAENRLHVQKAIMLWCLNRL